MQLRQSGFRTAGEIRNPGKLCLLNLESRVLKSAIRSPTNDWNSKSKFKHWVPGIGNPWHGIQNPRLCLIPLHQATAWFSDMSEKSRKPPPFLTMCQENSIDSCRCHSDRVENTRIKWLEDWVRAKMIAYRSPTVQIWLSEGNWSTRITYIRIWDALGNRNAPDSLELSPGIADLISDIYDFKFDLGRSPGNSQIADRLGFFRQMKTRLNLRMLFVSF